MKIYDITVPVQPQMPVWPGDPAVEIHQVSVIGPESHANVSHLKLGAHTGTHVDAPWHFVAEGIKLDQVPLEVYVGPALVVELADVDIITRADIAGLALPPNLTRILFKTRNSQIWACRENRFQEDFVALREDAALDLVQKGIRLVGIDYLSIAPYRNSVPTHRALLEAEVAVVEGLNLSAVTPGMYQLTCLPLRLNVDGAPARAILTELPK